MKKEQLKQVLKPLIKECIKEVMFEDGTLSGIISEVVQGLNAKPLAAAPPPKKVLVDNTPDPRERVTKKIKEAKKAMLDAMGKDAYNGVNIFEGTTPMRSAGTAEPTPQSPLQGLDPSDAGIDISGIVNLSNNKWKDLI
jgi:hypothetical protein